jgi:hypothetical protein
MRADPAVVLADTLRTKGVYAAPRSGADGPHLRVGVLGAPSTDIDIRCHPAGGYLTDRDIQLGTATDLDGTVEMILSLFGRRPQGAAA